MNDKKIEVNIADILSEEFIKKFTEFHSVDEFILCYPIDEEKPELTEKELDEWISEVSVFKTYEEFKGKAGKDYMFTKVFGKETMEKIRK